MLIERLKGPVGKIWTAKIETNDGDFKIVKRQGFKPVRYKKNGKLYYRQK